MKGGIEDDEDDVDIDSETGKFTLNAIFNKDKLNCKNVEFQISQIENNTKILLPDQTGT